MHNKGRGRHPKAAHLAVLALYLVSIAIVHHELLYTAEQKNERETGRKETSREADGTNGLQSL